MKITIRKIADDLNLAVSTVSKALNDSHEISDETKRTVLNYVNKVGYKPNPYAGSLKNRKTQNIAVILPEVADTFFSNAINGIESIAQNQGYHVMVYQTHENAELEASILRELGGGRVDGILISVSGGVKRDSSIHTQVANKIPLVFFDRVCDEVHTAKVLTDDFESSYNATSLLILRGCREIIFLSAAGDLSIVDHRKDGFRKALIDNGIEVGEHTIVQCSGDSDENLKILQRVLTQKKKIDGVVASVEKLAMQVYSICQSIQLSIPENIKIIAFSNLQIASLLAPSLSTVEQPAFKMGETAATLLFKSLAKKIALADQRLILPSVIHERESTALK